MFFYFLVRYSVKLGRPKIAVFTCYMGIKTWNTVVVFIETGEFWLGHNLRFNETTSSFKFLHQKHIKPPISIVWVSLKPSPPKKRAVSLFKLGTNSAVGKINVTLTFSQHCILMEPYFGAVHKIKKVRMKKMGLKSANKFGKTGREERLLPTQKPWSRAKYYSHFNFWVYPQKTKHAL